MTVVPWVLEQRLSSCGAWAQVLCTMWDLHSEGLDRCILLDRQILHTEPPGRSQLSTFICLLQTEIENPCGVFLWDETVTQRDSGYWFCVLPWTKPSWLG